MSQASKRKVFRVIADRLEDVAICATFFTKAAFLVALATPMVVHLTSLIVTP